MADENIITADVGVSTKQTLLKLLDLDDPQARLLLIRDFASGVSDDKLGQDVCPAD